MLRNIKWLRMCVCKGGMQKVAKSQKRKQEYSECICKNLRKL